MGGSCTFEDEKSDRYSASVSTVTRRHINVLKVKFNIILTLTTEYRVFFLLFKFNKNFDIFFGIYF